MPEEPETEGPAATPAPAVDPKIRFARTAAALELAAVAAAEFLAVALATQVVIAILWGVFGVSSVLLAWYLYHGRFTAWGTAAIANAFALLIALLQFNLVVIGAAAASFLVLYAVRLPFGVGAWKIEAAKEDAQIRRRIQERTSNAGGVRCPKCGSDRLWIGEDGSAFCLACRAGTVELAGRAL